MVDMGDDGEIADFGQISHAWGYDLDSAIGQAETSLVPHSFPGELKKLEQLDSQKRFALASRAILRTAFCAPTYGQGSRVSNDLLLRIFRLALRFQPFKPTLARTDLGLSIDSDEYELIITASFGSDQIRIKHSKERQLYEVILPQAGRENVKFASMSRNLLQGSFPGLVDGGNLCGDASFLSQHKDTNDVFRLPLWAVNKANFDGQNLALSTQLSAQPSLWSFWRDWYQGFLDGKPLDWKLQRRVALIDDAIWEDGPEAVAEEIQCIQAEMLAEKLPMAERIEVNPDTGKFRAIPIPVENPTTLSALLSQIDDALEDCLGGHNGLVERSGNVKKLNRVLTKYKDDPQNAELTLTRVAGSLRSQLHDTRELPDNEDNLALLNAVEEGVRGIRANHPEVANNREQLAQQALQALAPEDKELLQQALPVLAEISEPELADDFAADIPELINDALLPRPNGAPPLPGADVTTRIFSRISKMALLIQNGKDLAQKGAETFDSDLVKSVRLAGLAISVTGGIGGILFALVKVGLNILGVL